MPNLCHANDSATHIAMNQHIKTTPAKINAKKHPTKMVGYTIKMKITFRVKPHRHDLFPESRNKKSEILYHN